MLGWILLIVLLLLAGIVLARMWGRGMWGRGQPGRSWSPTGRIVEPPEGFEKPPDEADPPE